MIRALVVLMSIFPTALAVARADNRPLDKRFDTIDKRLNVIEQRLDARRAFEEKLRRDQMINPGSGWQRQPDGKFIYQEPRR